MEEERFERFNRLISSIYKSIQRIKAGQIGRFGLKGVHVLWVYQLSRCPEGMSPAALARSSGMNRSLVSRELDLLLREGYAAEAPCAGDKRRYNLRLRLTGKGRELAGEIGRIVRRIQDELDEGVSEAELATFYRVLGIIDKRLEEQI